MTTITLGIDISKDKFDVALFGDDSYKTAAFENNKQGQRRLLNWLKKRKAQNAWVCIEATGRYGEAVTTFLYKHGFAVSVVNPARIKAYAASQLKRNKADLEDAKIIAHFCATQKRRLWTPPPAEVQELKELSRRLENLQTERTRELNRQKSSISSQTVLQSIEAHITFLDEQIALVKKQIFDLIKKHPDLRQKHHLLTSIPGIGKLTSAKLLAEITDFSSFDSAPALAAYAGLTPRNHDSGATVHRQARLAKTGNSHFRTAFYMPALSAIRYNPIISNMAFRLEERGKKKMTIVAAAMRKLVHLAFGVLKTGMPFDPNYVVNMQETA